MNIGARYRTPSGCIYELERIGTSLNDPCVLRCVEIGQAVMSVLGGWAHVRDQGLVSHDGELADLERALQRIESEEERLKLLVDHTMARRLKVEPAWFEHAAVEVRS